MKNKLRFLTVAVSTIIMLTACGKDPELEKFKVNVDNFCTNISTIDAAINSVDATSEDAVPEVLGYLEQLDAQFKLFASLDFPEEFDYLEDLAVEASDYMSEAVSSYTDVYTNDSYSEEMFTATYEYAKENYSRAYKRIQIIITFLHGEEPEAVGLGTSSE